MGYQKRIDNRPFLALVATQDSQLLGFKLGYELDEETFYSWVGGVLPAHRGRGVANGLLHFQENWAMEQGYHCIQVKSMNCYPDMLKMLISNQYKISHCDISSDLNHGKIHFSKQL